MKKSEELKTKRKIKFKCFLLAHILTLFFALAPASPAGGNFSFAADKSFDFGQKNAYSEPFSKLIEFLNDKKNELEKYDGSLLSAKAFLKNSYSEAETLNELNPVSSSFLASVIGSVKGAMKNVFDSAKSFVFTGDNQNSFEYTSPTNLPTGEAGGKNAKEIENLKQQYEEAIKEANELKQNFTLLQSEMGKIKAGGIIVKEPVIEQRRVEKTIEKIISGLSQTDLDSGISSVKSELNNLNTNLTNKINNLSSDTSRQTSAVYNAVSLTNKIDSLSGTRLSNITVSGVTGLTDSDIPDTITASNYLPLTGGTITGALTVSGQTSLTNATATSFTATNAWFTDKVGIGTSSPYAKLSVVGPVAAEYFHATSTTATSTFSGQLVSGFAPTWAHSFGSWSVGAAGANPLGASFIINPSSAASDSNLLSLSVNGSAKFLVDAEGDIFANGVTIVGGTTLSTTTAATFTVENNTVLGDSTTTDITYFNSRVADSLIPTADNALDLGDSANWLRWRTGYFGTSVGIGGTATSTGSQLTTSGAYLIDSNGALSINTTNNKTVSFGTGNVSFPYASTTALTVSGNSYLGAVSSGTWNGSIIGVPYGGTGWAAIQSGTIPYGNGTGALATTSVGTDGYVLALSAGVPTWLATSTLSTITGTLAVAKGGTGQTSFGQGWLHSDGTTLTSSTSPTVNYLTATATTGTSTFPYLSVTTNSNLGTVVGGTWQGTAVGSAFGGTGINSSALTGLAQIVAGTWSASSTLSTAFGGTGWNNIASGYAIFGNGAGALATSSSFYWDNSNSRLGIGTTSPNSKLTVYNGAADSAIEFSSASGDAYKWTMGLDYSDAGKFKIASSTALGSIDRFTIDGNGYVGIGTSTPSGRLEVTDSGTNIPQIILSRESGIHTDLSVAQTTGDLSLNLYGANANDVSLYSQTDVSNGANLWVCEGAACPNGISFTGGGNLFVEGVIKYATSTTPKTRRSIILTAAGAIVPSASGAAKTQVDGTNHSYYVLDFDASSDEAAFWQWTMPDSYDNGSIDITYYWEAGATSGDTTFCFQAKGLSANSAEDIDSSLSSSVCETDTAQANANDLASMTETNATSNFTAGEYATFKVFRDADVAGDTMTGDARLVKVKIEYGVATESD